MIKLISHNNRSVIDTILRDWNTKRAFLFIVVFFNSQIVSATQTNAFGIKGAQEVLLVIIFLFSVFYVASKALENKIIKIDLVVFCLIVAMWFYAAIAANLRFNQPILYGLLEERRVLSFLVYFPVIWALRGRITTIEDTFNYILFTAIVCCLVAFGIVNDYIPQLQVIEVGAGQLRQERYGIGNHYITFALIYSAYLIGQRIFIFRSIAIFTLALLTLLIVVQTRQLIIAVGFSLLVMYIRFTPTALIRVLLIALAIFFALILLPSSSDLLMKYMVLFSDMFSDDYLESSARATSYLVVYQNILDGYLLGSGGLSLLWQNGFARVFGPNFFLADLGLVGSIFKYGILAVFIYLIYIVVQIMLIRCVRRSDISVLLMGLFSYIMIAIPVAAPIEYRGFISGLLLAISVYACKALNMPNYK